MKKRMLSLTLCMLLSIGTLSCGESGTESPVSTADTTAAETTSVASLLGFPETDYGGQEFNILSTVHAEYEYDVEEQTGDIVSDAIYKRNTAVEELLGIKLNIITEPGHWDDRTHFNGLIQNSVMAGDGAYDLVNGVTVCVLPIAQEGVFIDANELEYVDFSNPWWIQGMNDDLAIGGKLYGFIGDASLSLYKDLSVVFFNKQLLEDYKLENPYDLVNSGNWTIDKMMELSSAVSTDVNGDNEMNIEQDVFGYFAPIVPNRALQTAIEFTVIDFDEDDAPFIATLSERDADAHQKLWSFFANSENVYIDTKADHVKNSTIFNEGHVLFFASFLYSTEHLREMDADFGIIPYPKRETAQSDYHTQIGTSTSMFFVPKTAGDPALTSMVCEALSYYSYLDVVPSYYEIALKEKYTRDDDVKEMLEIIRESAQMDFTFAYSTMFSTFTNTMFEMRKDQISRFENIASYYASHQTEWEKTLESIVEAYQNIQ